MLFGISIVDILASPEVSTYHTAMCSLSILIAVTGNDVFTFDIGYAPLPGCFIFQPCVASNTHTDKNIWSGKRLLFIAICTSVLWSNCTDVGYTKPHAIIVSATLDASLYMCINCGASNLTGTIHVSAVKSSAHSAVNVFQPPLPDNVRTQPKYLYNAPPIKVVSHSVGFIPDSVISDKSTHSPRYHHATVSRQSIVKEPSSNGSVHRVQSVSQVFCICIVHKLTTHCGLKSLGAMKTNHAQDILKSAVSQAGITNPVT